VNSQNVQTSCCVLSEGCCASIDVVHVQDAVAVFIHAVEHHEDVVNIRGVHKAKLVEHES
jgi:hypothetical protein